MLSGVFCNLLFAPIFCVVAFLEIFLVRLARRVTLLYPGMIRAWKSNESFEGRFILRCWFVCGVCYVGIHFPAWSYIAFGSAVACWQEVGVAT